MTALPLVNVNRLRRAWQNRLVRRRCADLLLCVLLTMASAIFASRAAALILPPETWTLVGLVALPPLLALAAMTTGPGRRHWDRLLAVALAWPLSAASLRFEWPDMVEADLLIVAIVATALPLAAWQLVNRRRFCVWLDDRLGSRLLLTTATELAGRRRPLGPLESAVLARAEALAGRRHDLRPLAPPGLDVRWWAILGVLLAATLLVHWVGRNSTGDVQPAGGAGNPAQSAGDQAARRLQQLVLIQGDAAGPLAQVANTVQQAATPAEAEAALAQGRDRLAAQVAAVQPVLDALAALAEQPAGQPLSALLAEPNQTNAQAVAAARRQAGQWRELSAVERTRLAGQLRDAAARLAERDPELAKRLRAMADALAAARWQTVLDQLDAVVAHVQPIARHSRLNRQALATIDDALARVAGPAAAPALASAAEPSIPADTQPDDPDWQQAQDHARRQLQSQTLSAEQQQLIRRYFGLE